MPREVDRRQFLQLAGANAAALALGPFGAAAPGRSEQVGQTQTDIELFEAESMSAVTQLMYAEISDEQKRLIGAGNLKRLISEIKR
jgi:hypothetical protein